MWSSRLDKRCLTDWRVSYFIGFLLSVDTLSVNIFGEFSLISINGKAKAKPWLYLCW